MEKPYVPFYKPIGMTDEEYEYEVRMAEERLAEWEEEILLSEDSRDVEINDKNKPMTIDKPKENKMSDKFVVIDHDGNGWSEVMECDTEIEAIAEKEEWAAEHKYSQADVLMKCRHCLDWYEIGKSCGCKDSVEYNRLWEQDGVMNE